MVKMRRYICVLILGEEYLGILGLNNKCVIENFWRKYLLLKYIVWGIIIIIY